MQSILYFFFFKLNKTKTSRFNVLSSTQSPCFLPTLGYKMLDICIFAQLSAKQINLEHRNDWYVMVGSLCRFYLLPMVHVCVCVFGVRLSWQMLVCSRLYCICGLLLEKGLQVSNLIEIIPLKWTLVQHSCFVNPISCMQSIYTMQNRIG